MIEIYHNPRCSKSRCGLDLVKDSGANYRIVDYMKKGITAEELKEILMKLGIPAIDLVRRKEAIWKELYEGRALCEEEVIEAMVQHPKLIERPIVVIGNRAVIGRPTENISRLLDDVAVSG